MNIKLRFVSIVDISVGSYIDTRWGNDYIQLEITEIVEAGTQFKLWEVRANIVTCRMEYYES